MSDSIPVPRNLVEEILGNLPGDVTPDLGDVTYETICEMDDSVTEVPLTPAQVGELFKFAWADVELDMSSAIEGTSPLEYAMAGNIESEERLRDLVQWAYGGVPKYHKMIHPKLFTVARHGEGCFLLTRKGTLVAQVSFQPASVIPKRDAYWFAAFAGEPLDEAEMREVSDILGILNYQADIGTEFRL